MTNENECVVCTDKVALLIRAVLESNKMIISLMGNCTNLDQDIMNEVFMELLTSNKAAIKSAML